MITKPNFKNKTLQSEFNYLLDVINETEDMNELSEEEKIYMVVSDIEDACIDGRFPKNYLSEIREWLIELKVYIPITMEQMGNMVVSSGKKNDFKLKGTYYIFDKEPIFPKESK